MFRIHHEPPPLVAGYELNPLKGFFSVIIPEATINLIANPSMELNLTGYNNVGGSAPTRTMVESRRGAWGLTNSPAATQGIYYTPVPLVSGTTYTFSLDFLGRGGFTYRIYFADAAGALLGTAKVFTATGGWERPEVTYTETSTADRRVYVIQDSVSAGGIPFYADGFQVEAKTYATTYCDGDCLGLVPGRQDFFWSGLQHASSSQRLLCRAGGREIPLQQLGFRVLGYLGAGMPPIRNDAQPYGWQDGSYYERSAAQDRQFTLTGYLEARTLSQLQSKRLGLIEILRIDETIPTEPMVLRYRYTSKRNSAENAVDLRCLYTGGLEGQIDNVNQERIGLSFVAFDPFAYSDHEEGTSLFTGTESLAYNDDTMFYQKPDGSWGSRAGLLTGGIVVNNYLIYYARANVIYQYDPLQDVETVLGTANGAVYAFAVGSNGALYVGGAFTTIDAVGRAGIAKYYLGAWSSIGTGVTGTGSVFTLAVVPVTSLGLEYIVAGGDFTNMGGVAAADNIAYWDNAAWNAMGTGLNGTVYAVAHKPGTNRVTIGGAFTDGFGVSFADRLAYFDLLTLIGAEFTFVGPNATVRDLIFDRFGTMYIVGDFTTVEGVTVNYIATRRSDTGVWATIGGGSNGALTRITLSVDQSRVYAGGGAATAVSFVSTDIQYDLAAWWSGLDWLPLGLQANGNGTLEKMLVYGPKNRVILGFNTTAAAVNAGVSILTTIRNNGSAKTYPVFRLQIQTPPLGASGRLLFIINEKTGGSVYFNDLFSSGAGLTVYDTETIDLILQPGRVLLVSSVRGVLSTKLASSSNLPDLVLLPGDNVLRLWHSTIPLMTIFWRERFWGVDGVE